MPPPCFSGPAYAWAKPIWIDPYRPWTPTHGKNYQKFDSTLIQDQYRSATQWIVNAAVSSSKGDCVCHVTCLICTAAAVTLHASDQWKSVRSWKNSSSFLSADTTARWSLYIRAQSNLLCASSERGYDQQLIKTMRSVLSAKQCSEN